MHAKKLTSDAMYINKYATADDVLAKISDPENITSEESRKVLAPLRRQKDKVMPKKATDILIWYSQWVHVEKRGRRVIDDEKNNLDVGNSTYFSGTTISADATDGLIATAIDAGNSTDSADNAAGGLTAAINAGDQTGCADLLISDDVADGLITTAIDAVNLADCADDAAGGLIAAIDAGDSMDCTDISISDDAADGWIAAYAGNSTDCSDTNVSDDAVDGLMMLMR